MKEGMAEDNPEERTSSNMPSLNYEYSSSDEEKAQEIVKTFFIT